MRRRPDLQAPLAYDRRYASHYRQRWNGRVRHLHQALAPVPVARFRHCQRPTADPADHRRRRHLRQEPLFDLPLRPHHPAGSMNQSRLSPRHCRRLDHRRLCHHHPEDSVNRLRLSLHRYRRLDHRRLRHHHPEDSVNRLRLSLHRCRREAHHRRPQAGNVNRQQ